LAVFVFSASRLWAIREQLGWTREQLATESGLSYQSVFGYEHGHRVPSRASVLRLAAALGVSPRELVDEDPAFAEAAL